jgi:hypothetical protein
VVFTVTGALAADVFWLASTAFTVYVYVVFGCSGLSVAVVSGDAWTGSAALSRKIR